MTLMRSPLPALVAARLRLRGLDAQACLREFELQRALEDSHVIAPVETLAAFYDDAAKRLEQPNLGLDLVDAIDRGAYGLAEFGIRAAPTVREAIGRLARFSTLLNEATVVTVEETADQLRVHQHIPGYPLSGGRHSNEYFIAVLLAFGGALAEGAFVVNGVWFCHAAPAELGRHREIFGDTPIRFDEADNGFSIPRALADAPLRSADPALMQAIDAQAEQLLSKRRPAPEFINVVREAIGRALRNGPLSLSDAAHLLAMTPRTLQRRLGEHDTSFREVLDSLRRELHEQLAAQGVSTEEIAFRLGYTDMGSFRRAQRRWASSS